MFPRGRFQPPAANWRRLKWPGDGSPGGAGARQHFRFVACCQRLRTEAPISTRSFRTTLVPMTARYRSFATGPLSYGCVPFGTASVSERPGNGAKFARSQT